MATRTKPKPKVKDPAERTKGETVPPTKTLRLMDTIGASRTSRMLGVSTTTLFKAKKFGFVSRVIEVAAEGALASLAGPPTTTTLGVPAKRQAFLVEVDESKREAFLKLASALGAEVIAA